MEFLITQVPMGVMAVIPPYIIDSLLYTAEFRHILLGVGSRNGLYELNWVNTIYCSLRI